MTLELQLHQNRQREMERTAKRERLAKEARQTKRTYRKSNSPFWRLVALFM
jgi:hypothetical protein